MNKGELIESLAKKAGMSKTDAGKALNSVLDIIMGNLKKGDKVTLPGFGTFDVIKRAARKGRNPQTGKDMKIAAKKVPKFKAGSKMKAMVK
jgi:DNA-binding protein HU-beta